MDITYLGAGSVKLSGRDLTVVSDPLTAPRAEVVVTTGPAETGQKWPVGPDAMLIDGPGEYEVKRAMITGLDY